MARIVPTVTVADAPAPWWVRFVLRRSRRGLRDADCVLVVRVVPLLGWMYPLPEPWDCAGFTVDGTKVGMTSSQPREAFAVGLAAGRHTFAVVVQPSSSDVVEPIALELQRGTVVVMVGLGRDYDAGRVAPEVGVQVLPHGFARNGRWGEQWSRRLGWEHPAAPPGPPADPVVLDPTSVALPPPPAKPSRGGLLGGIIDSFIRGYRGR